MPKIALIIAMILTFVCDVKAETGTSPARGDIYEFDPGPSKDSKWVDLFAETPNYRGIGRAIIGGHGEKFRWFFGPMFYRGRLTSESVKVFVVGQEGAQDENVSNRSFTGSTGTKMQNFLNSLGITESYLFMNTFVYTIFGQYTDFKMNPPGIQPDVKWVAQNPESPVVQHRHRMFDYMYETNSKTLALVIGVGRAGQDSVVTWIQHKANEAGLDGAQLCPSANRCDASFLGEIKVLGLPHPGGASALNGGDEQGKNIIQAFDEAADRVWSWMESEPTWLSPDSLSFKIPKKGSFKYKNAPIPHRDFPFGTMWSMGNSGTSSNRESEAVYRKVDGKRVLDERTSSMESIHVFSEGGCYNALIKVQDGSKVKCANFEEYQGRAKEPLAYKTAADVSSRLPEMTSTDVPWEPAKDEYTRRSFDAGPSSQSLAQLLMGKMPGYEWPDFQKLGVTVAESFGQGAIYRGRLNQARVLILADQESADDLFSTRALTGAGGQKLQTLLNSMGIISSYAIIRTLPVDTLDLTSQERVEIVTKKQVSKVLNKIVETVLSEGQTELVLTVGTAAKAFAAQAPALAETTVINLAAPDTKVSKQEVEAKVGSKKVTYTAGEIGTSEQENWNEALKEIKKLHVTTDNKAIPSYTYDGTLTAIPRIDLPYGTRFWIGTSGSRAARGYNRGKAAVGNPISQGLYKKEGYDPDYFKVYAPFWVSLVEPKQLTKEEADAVRRFLEQ